jgi:hypothetical protein
MTPPVTSNDPVVLKPMDTRSTAVGLRNSSARPGKYLTLIVTVMVLGLTAKAFFSNRDLFSAGGLRIALPGGPPSAEAEPLFAVLAHRLVSVSGRSVTYVEPSAEADLYIQPLATFLEVGPKQNLVPLYSLTATTNGREGAVLFTTAADSIVVDQLSPAEVVFTDPDDANGFWAQLVWLRERGFHLPERESDFRFEDGGDISARLVYSVLWGRYKIGACRMSDLVRLLDRGFLHPGEVRVIAMTTALPDFIISSRPESAGRLSERLAALSDARSSSGSEDGFSIAPIDETALKRVGRLAADLSGGL